MKFSVLVVALLILSLGSVQGLDDIPEFRKDKRILYWSPIASSHERINVGIARNLGLLGYNVTFSIMNKSLPLFKSLLEEANVNIVIQPDQSQQREASHRRISEDMNANQSYFKLWNSALSQAEYLLVDHFSFFERLKAEKFDMIISEHFEYNQIVVSYLEMPMYIQIVNGPAESHLLYKNKLDVASYSQINQLRFPLMGSNVSDPWTIRYHNFLTSLFINVFHHPHLYWLLPSRIPEDRQQYITNRKFPDLILVLNIEGINPPLPLPQNVKLVFPKYKQQLSEKDQEIDPELAQLYEKYNEVVIISYGTANRPMAGVEQMFQDFILNRAQHDPNLAIIMINPSFPRDKLTPEQKAWNKQNPTIFVTHKVPLVKLLNHNKTIALISHGGQNQFIEAIEARLPIIIAPSVIFDNQMYCKYVEKMQYGFCIPEMRPSYLKLVSAVKQIRQNLNQYRERLAPLSQAITAKRLEEQGQVEYWVDYAFEVGDLTHLSEDSKIFRDMYFLAYMDLDVRVLLIAIILTPPLLIVLWVIKRVLTIIKNKITSPKIDKAQIAIDELLNETKGKKTEQKKKNNKKNK